MEKAEILYQILNLNNTLYEAAAYVIQNAGTGADTVTILNDMKDAVGSISSKASLVLDLDKAAEVRRSANALQGASDALISGKPVRVFSDRFDEWSTTFCNAFYADTINTANACTGADDDLAIEMLELMLPYGGDQIKALVCFTLSRKLGKKDPLRAYQLGMEAFAFHPALCANITQSESRIHNYVYQNVKDAYFEECPICHEGKGTPYYSAMPLFMANYTPFFNPVKLWMQCDACGQLFAYNFPQKLAEPQPEEEELGDEGYMKPMPQFLPILGGTIKRILSYAKGHRLLEVGAGTGELIAVALEYGCEVEAIEISQRQSRRLRELLGVDIHCMDFLKYETSGRFDIVTMGDVLEHVTDPAGAIRRAHALLEKEGILWISTPNFESGFTRIMKYGDPMWNEPWHITYFSSDGVKKLLGDNGFTVLDYEVSGRFRGSMEIIAQKV